MWKYVAFVLLIIFCVPAVLGQDGDSAGNATAIDITTTTVSSTTALPTTTVTTTTPASPTTDPTTLPTTTVSPTTSTAVPTTTSTAAPTTTTSAPTTTVLPPPSVFTYIVHDKDDNKTCIRAELAIRVALSHSPSYNFVNASTDGSDCNSTDNSQILRLTDESTDTTIIFIFKQEGQKYYAENITYGNVSNSTLAKVSGHYFSASEGKSYLCNAEVSVHMSDAVTLTFSSVHVQAYGAQSFGLAEECDADDKVGDIVPIAVGCALGALVVIVLIAYLVGRRRSRQRGYQSV